MAEAIGLVEDWPTEIDEADEMTVKGLWLWSRSYLRAAETLYFGPNSQDVVFYAGPIMQALGLGTELTLKTVLRGAGTSSRDLRGFGHDTYKAYRSAKEYFDEVKFLSLHFSNTQHIPVPKPIRERFEKKGEASVESRWRVYFDHLRLLDTMYDRPYRTRYMTPGEVNLPDAEVVLVGTNIILEALGDRLG